MLLSEGAICLFDALDHDRLHRIPHILARGPAALNRPFAECISRKPKPEDWHTPLVRMVSRGKAEAVHVLLDFGADISARHSDGRSRLQLATDEGFAEIGNCSNSTALLLTDALRPIRTATERELTRCSSTAAGSLL